MYAIIKTGGKQIRVMKDQIVDIELIEGEAGASVQFGEVLFVNDGSSTKLGAPHIAGCHVKGEILDVVKGPKIDSVKYKQRKRQYKHWGHRQKYSRVKITEIAL